MADPAPAHGWAQDCEPVVWDASSLALGIVPLFHDVRGLEGRRVLHEQQYVQDTFWAPAAADGPINLVRKRKKQAKNNHLGKLCDGWQLDPEEADAKAFKTSTLPTTALLSYALTKRRHLRQGHQQSSRKVIRSIDNVSLNVHGLLKRRSEVLTSNGPLTFTFEGVTLAVDRGHNMMINLAPLEAVLPDLTETWEQARKVDETMVREFPEDRWVSPMELMIFAEGRAACLQEGPEDEIMELIGEMGLLQRFRNSFCRFLAVIIEAEICEQLAQQQQTRGQCSLEPRALFGLRRRRRARRSTVTWAKWIRRALEAWLAECCVAEHHGHEGLGDEDQSHQVEVVHGEGPSCLCWMQPMGHGVGCHHTWRPLGSLRLRPERREPQSSALCAQGRAGKSSFGSVSYVNAISTPGPRLHSKKLFCFSKNGKLCF